MEPIISKERIKKNVKIVRHFVSSEDVNKNFDLAMKRFPKTIDALAKC